MEPEIVARKRYLPVSQCIYCYSFDDLSDEHIIPKGLKGTWVLPAASCERCRRITGKFEQACLRNVMGRFRRAAGFPSSKKLPSELSVNLRMPDGGTEGKSVPIAELPTIVSLPRWTNQPSKLTGENKPFTISTWTWAKHGFEENILRLGGRGIEIAQIQPIDFARMIAKVLSFLRGRAIWNEII